MRRSCGHKTRLVCSIRASCRIIKVSTLTMEASSIISGRTALWSILSDKEKRLILVQDLANAVTMSMMNVDWEVSLSPLNVGESSVADKTKVVRRSMPTNIWISDACFCSSKFAVLRSNQRTAVEALVPQPATMSVLQTGCESLTASQLQLHPSVTLTCRKTRGCAI